MIDGDTGDAHVTRMRAGVRAGVVGRMRAGMPRLTPARLAAMMCATALSPLLVAGPGLGAVVAAGVGVLGSIGAGVLTEIVLRVPGSFAGRARPPTQGEIEDDLADQIEAVLVKDDATAMALRSDIAAVLQTTSAVETVLGAALETGDRELPGEVVLAFMALGTRFKEFGFVMTAVSDGVWEIQEALRRQEAERRADRERSRRRDVELRLLREELAVIEHRTRPVNSPTTDRPKGWEGCPYRGLWPFEEDHAEVFYGRERMTAELIASLAERLSGVGMLVVTGASGAGKSSLLRAGLLPALARGSLVPGSEWWPRMVMTPTRSPLDELAAHMAAFGGMDIAQVRQTLVETPDKAYLIARQVVLAAMGGLASAAHPRLIVLVDQFEELFTVTGGEYEDATSQRTAFLTALHSIASTPAGPDGNPPGLVVLGIRGDYWDRCSNYPQLAAAVRAGPFVVGPMTESELRRAIIGPASAAGLETEPGLTETILGDLRGTRSTPGFDGGTLPLLSQATMVTWEHREGGRLTSHGYGRAGGVAFAVQTSAEAAYHDLTPAQQEIARAMLLRLTIVARDGQLARRRLTRANLAASDGWRGSDVEAVLDAFAAKRLIILNGDMVEIAHDVFLHAWPRLRAWVDDDQADRALYSQLIEDASIWQKNGFAASFLYRGVRLAAVQRATSQWAGDSSRYPALPESAHSFLDASNRAATRTARIRRIVAAGLVALTLAAGSAAATASWYAVDANRQHSIALSRQLTIQSQSIRQTNPVTARRLAVAAWHLAPINEARDNITDLLAQQRGILVGHTAPGTGLAFSPHRPVLASAGADQTVRLWDTATGHPIGAPLTGHGGVVHAVAFHPGNGMVASASADRTVRLWDSTTGVPVGDPLLGHTGAVYAVAFRPDGRMLATTSADYSVRLWDPGSGDPIGDPLVGHTGPVYAVTFSPDGRVLVSTSADGTVRVWDSATGEPVGQPLVGHTGTVFHAAFHPTRGLLATASADGTVRLWDPVAGKPVGRPLTEHTGPVNAVAFRPDGGLLATASADGTVRLWDPVAGEPVGEPLTGHTGSVNSLVFRPDGQTLAALGDDGAIRLWDPVTGHVIGDPVTGHLGTIYAVAFEPHGRVLASTSADRTVRLWDPLTGRAVGSALTGHDGPVTGVTFSPDGSMLATTSDDGTVRRWDPVTGQAVGKPMTGHEDAVHGVAFSPDGRMLATVSADRTVRRWDPVTGQAVGGPMTGHSDVVYGVAFSPDGRVLTTVSADHTVRHWDPATGLAINRPLNAHTDWVTAVAYRPDGQVFATTSTDGTVRLWDAVTGLPVVGPMRHSGPVNGVAFSSDGRVLATVGADRTARLWDAKTGQAIGHPLTGHTGPVTGVVFSPDGRVLTTTGYDRTVRMWDPALYQDPPASICDRVGSPSRDEWERFAPGEPLPQVCK